MARLCNSSHLTLDFRRRWEVRGALVEALGHLIDPNAKFSEHEYYPDAVLEASIAQAQLDMDLGRMEQAEFHLFSQVLEEAVGQNHPALGLARVQWEYNNRTFEFVEALPKPDEAVDELELELYRQSLGLAIRAQLQTALEAALAGREAKALASEAFDEAERLFQHAPGHEAPYDYQSYHVLLSMALLAVEVELPAKAEALLERASRWPLLQGPSEGLGVVPHLELDITRARVWASSEWDRDWPASRVEALNKRIFESWGKLVHAWSQAPSPEGGIGFLFTRARRNLFQQAIAASRRLHGDLGGFKTLVEAQALGGLERGLALKAPSLADVQAALKPGSAGVLVFVPGDYELLVGCIDQTGLTWFKTRALRPILGRLRSLHQSLRKEINEPGQAPTSKLAKEIGDHLWTKPIIERTADWDHVVLVGSELLDELPLLAVDFGKHGPLGLHKPVSFVPSLPFLVHLARRADQASDTALEILAGATGLEALSPSGSSLVPLPPVDWTQHGVDLESPGLQVIEGADVSRSELTMALADEVELLTLLSHGVYDGTRLVPAGILLAGEDGEPGDFIWSEDLRGLAAPRFCVLLVCEMLRGLSRVGDGGAANPAGALLAAGSQAVLASASQLEMSTALEVFEGWRERWLAGEDLATALLQAKRRLPDELGSPGFRAQLLRAYGLGFRR